MIYTTLNHKPLLPSVSIGIESIDGVKSVYVYSSRRAVPKWELPLGFPATFTDNEILTYPPVIRSIENHIGKANLYGVKHA